ncbi:uncharacterized protein LOC133749231 [Lepus europaeus]|uniref:uncharacterized protein LOC133749231 n=1 Tax=Lepus europaeus TaxID=9983 RepID=UPI002B46E9EA|nr:uncharacterized protein LOC133749231 [Lepus europaeus]XP_062034430.1 uncharacterized protein LOC133749231 [Lepus europaeus]XP_062034431.1 uncharacterized protein LOC133749231 [Lepus europaeus]XP_062034432.1 uncharacterized protein LOC133749231 [Lepus europaeus]XP_062034433.1 uncharacterized protein LOC133749231 [Lepus europaeus]
MDGEPWEPAQDGSCAAREGAGKDTVHAGAAVSARGPVEGREAQAAAHLEGCLDSGGRLAAAFHCVCAPSHTWSRMHTAATGSSFPLGLCVPNHTCLHMHTATAGSSFPLEECVCVCVPCHTRSHMHIETTGSSFPLGVCACVCVPCHTRSHMHIETTGSSFPSGVCVCALSHTVTHTQRQLAAPFHWGCTRVCVSCHTSHMHTATTGSSFPLGVCARVYVPSHTWSHTYTVATGSSFPLGVCARVYVPSHTWSHMHMATTGSSFPPGVCMCVGVPSHTAVLPCSVFWGSAGVGVCGLWGHSAKALHSPTWATWGSLPNTLPTCPRSDSWGPQAGPRWVPVVELGLSPKPSLGNFPNPVLRTPAPCRRVQSLCRCLALHPVGLGLDFSQWCVCTRVGWGDQRGCQDCRVVHVCGHTTAGGTGEGVHSCSRREGPAHS